jgi:hypothetical protein
MALDRESVTVNGRRYAMDTSGSEFRTNQDYDNGAGLLGNIVGALSGGRVQVETRGNEIRVPEGSIIRFQLGEPLHAVRWGDPGYRSNSTLPQTGRLVSLIKCGEWPEDWPPTAIN